MRIGISRVIVLVVVVSLVAAACSSSGDGDPDDAAEGPTSTSTSGNTTPGSNRSGSSSGEGELGVTLSAGEPAASLAATNTQVEGEPLSDAELDAIFDRLPEWLVDDDQPAFNRPTESLRPPLVGDTVTTPFPADSGNGDGSVAPPVGPLQVLRYQPEGEVPVAPFLSVTFDQPMVPLATLDQLDDADVPAVVTPAIEGRWRWIGTRTLRFEVEPDLVDRLPAATEFTVEIPAGTVSATGGELAEAVSWSFATPTPQVETVRPISESMTLDPLLFVGFDQRIDPEAVLETISLTSDGDSREIRLATDAEIAADETVDSIVSAALDDRWLVVTPVQQLPTDAAIRLVIGPGAPSAEGPRTDDTVSRHDGRTYAPLRVVDSGCSYGGDRCEPGTPFTIRFNNPLDPASAAQVELEIEPELPGQSVAVYGDSIEIRGVTQGRTTYTVTVPASLVDVHGQALGDDVDVEIEVGEARPYLKGFDRQFLTVDPSAQQPGIDLVTVNHDSIRVRAYRVAPGDYGEFVQYIERFWDDPVPEVSDWPLVLDETVDVEGDDDAQVVTQVDLTDAYAESPSGQLVVRIDSTRQFARDSEDYWANRPSVAWVQSTDLGLDAVLDSRQLYVWATDLATGRPAGGVEVELLGTSTTLTTDADGLATAPLGSDGVVGLSATVDGGTAMLPSSWYEGWRQQDVLDEFRWYTFDDRGIYRPGETVRIKGWMRVLTRRDDAQIELFSGAETVAYTAYDSFGNELATGEAEMNGLGGFEVSYDIPEGANLGSSWIEFRLNGTQLGSASHSVQIEEFRRPEFEVTTRPETPGPYLAADPATVAVEATYFAGGPLPDAPVDWVVTTRDTTYSPPNRSDYSFGVFRPWWLVTGYGYRGGSYGGEYFDGDFCYDCGFDEPKVETFSGRTDSSGTHYLQMDFDGPDVDLPTTVSAEATVTDVNRQAWSDRSDLLVHPAAVYVGLRSERNFVKAGDPLDIEAIVTDVDGNAVAGRPVTIEAARLEWQSVDGVWTQVEVDIETCEMTSTDDAVTCTFTTDVPGTRKLTALVTDERGQTNRTELTRWVSGADRVPPTRRIEQEQVTIVPDRAEYAPGDSAELLVQAPFAPATGLVTVIRNGIVSTEVFDAPDGSAVVSVPIDDSQVPGVSVQIDMNGSAERLGDDGEPVQGAPDRPAFAVGRIDLPIPPTTRTLAVTADPVDDELEPGENTEVEVSVVDASGAPVAGAELAVVVVDEAVLALTGYELPDPLAVFYAPLYPYVTTEYARASIVLDDPQRLAETGGDESAGGDGALDGDAASPAPSTTVGRSAADDAAEESFDASYNQAGGSTESIDVRTNFDALAVYAPSETTGPDGTVTIDVPLPDNLTRYRVMVVAVDGADQFGTGESTITARLPVTVRPSAPRFLNFGDVFELPVVVQNQTDAEVTVDVGIQASNLVLTDGAGRRVTVPANDRVEVRFPAEAAEVGTARFRVAGVSGAAADAATIDLPVYTPATAEAFATYGVVDDGAVAQPVLSPEGVFPQFGGLEVTTSSTAVQALTDAVLYLTDYRYQSADAYASRILAISALRDVLEAFAADGLPSPAELDQRVDDDLEALAALQNDDGGFGYWRRGAPSEPYVSLHAAHALAAADDAGYAVPAQALERSLDYLRDIENRYPSYYSQTVRDSLSAYALHVRDLAGDRDANKANELYRRAGSSMALDAIAWLWPVLDDEGLDAAIERRFLDAAVETAGAATFTTGYDEDAYLVLASDRRTDGIVLDALIQRRPDSDLIPKVVAGLLGNQVRGRWNNIQENAFILLALHRYFETYEAQTPDFVARVWLGDTYAAEHTYQGRTTDRGETVVPMGDLIAEGDTQIVVSKDGDGRLYYRLGLRYAPDDLTLDPRDEGFVVDRVYEAVNDADEVRRNPDGSWRIAAGAEVRVRLTMVADARRTHVALIDPLPAGLEPLNPSLATSADLPPDASERESSWCWCWRWYEHQNLRDDRAEAHTSYLPAGTFEYTYVARATTPGTFVVPPARAEEVYAPEVFGRSSSATVVVEE